jgi:eukaryotic-like serine/threonine-protein kinase
MHPSEEPMESESTPTPHPALLPPGTEVGSWRVVGWAGRGVHGAVYRAVSVHPEQPEPVALKLALLPRDPRFTREVELLSRVKHPSVPRLLGHGEWRAPGGTPYPYAAMEWVDGVPLYEWAQEQKPSSREVARVLAQLARALQALHAQAGLHRDVKGDNVRVRRSDGRAMLLDFGTSLYAGAVTLTPPQVQPGTPAYQSPEAQLFSLRFIHDPAARYVARPTDDLYALGVTAWRIVTGEYPELAEPVMDAQGTWRLQVVVHAALRDEARVEPALRACILRMLSERPEERGSVEELAEALERAAGQMGPRSSLACASPPEQGRLWQRHLAVVASVALIAAGAWWVTSERSGEQLTAADHAEAVGVGPASEGTTGLGDSTAPTSTSAAPSRQAPEVLAREPLPEPRPGQVRPDAQGRCPRKRQIALNEGCWWETTLDGEVCAGVNGQMFKGKCYVPFIPSERGPTSGPTHKP